MAEGFFELIYNPLSIKTKDYGIRNHHLVGRPDLVLRKSMPGKPRTPGLEQGIRDSHFLAAIVADQTLSLGLPSAQSAFSI
jgi:hypothetical protein